MEGVTEEGAPAAAAVPSRPDPPVVGKVTHNSIELYWSEPAADSPAHATGPLVYTVQESGVAGSAGAGTVYHGSMQRCVVTGLDLATPYCFMLRASNDAGTGLWSPPVTVSTTRHSQSSENLHKAIVRGDGSSVRKILEEQNHYLETPDIHNSSPLMCACKHGRVKIVQILLSMGANVEYQNTSGKTSLMEACYYGQLECVKLLIAAGASWSTRDTCGMSAIHWAADGGQCDVVELALKNGVLVDDVHKTTVSGWTPLLRTAALSGNTAVARVLIHHGADVSRRDKDGKTPIMLAALNGHSDLVNLLISNGADPRARNEYGKTALDFARAFERPEVVAVLEAALAARKSSLTI